MNCIICGNPIETKLTPEGDVYWNRGNNPAPWPSDQARHVIMACDPDAYRCCDNCNNTVVIPMRLQASGYAPKVANYIGEHLADLDESVARHPAGGSSEES